MGGPADSSAMPTYVYETVPADPAEAPVRFEVKQSMKDAPLTKHPETGEPVRRVVVGGFAPMGLSNRSESPPPSGGCCGGSCACH